MSAVRNPALPAPHERRERRVVMGAVIVLLASALLSYGIVPAVRRWRDGQQQIETLRDRVAQLHGLVERSAALDAAANEAERRLAESPRRALHAPSASLAANTLQALLQEASEGAGLVVTRVDISPTLDSTGAAHGTVSAYGDVRGLATLLSTLTHGARVVVPSALTVQQNSALRGAPDVVQVTMTVRAPVVIEGRAQ